MSGCDAHPDEETAEETERRRYERAIDNYADCDAHRRSQRESDEICSQQGHVRGYGGKCICCGRSC